MWMEDIENVTGIWMEILCNDGAYKRVLDSQAVFCLACEAEARHMYCFSGVIVVVGGGVNFSMFRSFSRKL